MVKRLQQSNNLDKGLRNKMPKFKSRPEVWISISNNFSIFLYCWLYTNTFRNVCCCCTYILFIKKNSNDDSVLYQPSSYTAYPHKRERGRQSSASPRVGKWFERLLISYGRYYKYAANSIGKGKLIKYIALIMSNIGVTHYFMIN